LSYGGLLKKLAQTHLLARPLVEPADHAHGFERVAAQGEEALFQADVRAAQHFLE
jgi:hypothetical protein